MQLCENEAFRADLNDTVEYKSPPPPLHTKTRATGLGHHRQTLQSCLQTS